jgi:hypothetical protein
MGTERTSNWQRDLGLPLAALALPLMLGALTWPDGRALLPLLLAVPVSLIVGYCLRPTHVWLVWIAAMLVFVVGVVVGESTSLWAETTGAGRTDMYIPPVMWVVFALAFMAAMAGLVLLPLWFGRFIAVGRERERAALRRLEGHKTPEAV